MIYDIDKKTKKELASIVRIQCEEYDKLNKLYNFKIEQEEILREDIMSLEAEIDSMINSEDYDAIIDRENVLISALEEIIKLKDDVRYSQSDCEFTISDIIEIAERALNETI